MAPSGTTAGITGLSKDPVILPPGLAATAFNVATGLMWRHLRRTALQMGQVLRNGSQDPTGIAYGAFRHSVVLKYWQLSGVRVEVRQVTAEAGSAL
jgi:hypothetical protein